eukprot:TRINITY_DN5755_c0_g1_i1.p1 TRINITY_DN5755_c0_g1~~TRINITY_DN5755_c0_g1_i1.p1  ORF type:complete len:388 (+),score=29.85 TRINITY_DN5755_c0_g1_i1:87-1250(+)
MANYCRSAKFCTFWVILVVVCIYGFLTCVLNNAQRIEVLSIASHVFLTFTNGACQTSFSRETCLDVQNIFSLLGIFAAAGVLEDWDPLLQQNIFFRKICLNGNTTILMDNDDSFFNGAAGDGMNDYAGLVKELRSNVQKLQAELFAYKDLVGKGLEREIPIFRDFSKSGGLDDYAGDDGDLRKSWHLLQIQSFGSETEVGKRYFPKLLEMLADKAYNIWVSEVTGRGEALPSHFGISNAHWRLLFALDIQRDEVALNQCLQEISNGSRVDPEECSADPYTLVTNGRHITDAVLPLPERPTIEYQKNWASAGDALIFDDLFAHTSVTSPFTTSRVVLWIDLPRNDCGPLMHKIVQFMLRNVIGRVNPTAIEMINYHLANPPLREKDDL